MDRRQRLEAFRQLKSEVRGSEMYLLVGIDVAKDRHHAFFGTPNGRTISKRLTFDNNKNGFESLRNNARDLLDQNGLSKAVYGIEPTSRYHKPLAEYLICQGEDVVYVSNVAVKRNRELLDGRWDKNDKKDAANVADLMGQGKCLYYEMPDDNVTQIRSLLALRMQMRKQEHALRMRIRNNIVAQYFPEMDRHYKATDDLILSIVNDCLNPKEIAQLDFETFINRIASRRRCGRLQQKKAHAIWEAAKDSIGCNVTASIKWEAQSLVAQLKDVRETMAENDRRIKVISKRIPEYKYLLSIPGFGPTVSAVFLAAIGNASHFNDRRQVLRLAGFDLCAARSGKKSEQVKPVISKQGKASLRYALVQAAIVSSVKNPTIRAYFGRLIKGRESERGIKMKMKIKLAAKLAVIAWTLMKRKEFFDPDRFSK
jgi:transposase